MDLNHMHLASKNLSKSVEFYTGYFGFKKKFDHGEGVFLENDEKFMLAIDPIEDLPDFPSWFHIGFGLNSREEVRALFDKLKQTNIQITRDYADYGDDMSSFNCLDPDGYKVEVYWDNE